MSENKKAANPIDAYNQESDKSRGGGTFWKPSIGTHLIRILPTGGNFNAELNRTIFFASGAAHYNMGADGKLTVNCPRILDNKNCPICAWQKKLYESKEPSNIAIAGRIKKSNYWISNIIVFGQKPVVKQFRYGKKLHSKLMSFINDDEYGDITHPATGSNIKLKLKVVDGFNNYDDSIPEKNPSSLKDIYPNWKEEVADLRAQFCQCLQDEEIKRILDETMNLAGPTQDDDEPQAFNPPRTQQPNKPIEDDFGTVIGVGGKEQSTDDLLNELNTDLKGPKKTAKPVDDDDIPF